MSQLVSSVLLVCLCLSQVTETGFANADLGHLAACVVLVKIPRHVKLRLNCYLSLTWTFSTLSMVVECTVWMDYGSSSCQSWEAAEVVICSWC